MSIPSCPATLDSTAVGMGRGSPADGTLSRVWRRDLQRVAEHRRYGGRPCRTGRYRRDQTGHRVPGEALWIREPRDRSRQSFCLRPRGRPSSCGAPGPGARWPPASGPCTPSESRAGPLTRCRPRLFDVTIVTAGVGLQTQPHQYEPETIDTWEYLFCEHSANDGCGVCALERAGGGRLVVRDTRRSLGQESWLPRVARRRALEPWWARVDGEAPSGGAAWRRLRAGGKRGPWVRVAR